MSILYKNEEFAILSHSGFINHIYENTIFNGGHVNISIRNELFNIVQPFKNEHLISDDEVPSKKRRGKTKIIDLHPKTAIVKTNFENLVGKYKNEYSDCFSIVGIEIPHKNDVIEKCLNNNFTFETTKKCTGGNNLNDSICVPFANEKLILPANCKFVIGDVRNTLNDLSEQNFDFIVIDPPWWNKYIRRIKRKNVNAGYEMLYNKDLLSLPIPGLIAGNALVAVWCTNCENHEDFIITKLFPQWEVEHLATWFWLKVTQSGTPVCSFSGGTNKQPFERLVLGRKIDKNNTLSLRNPPPNYIFVSIPSLLQSHKPPLNDLLKEYIIKENPATLEVFSRYLLPNTTSVGYEPLKWQNESLYVIHENT